MIDLKPYYDDVQAKDAAVATLMETIDAAFKLGTPEGETQVLALQPQLDAAEKKAQDARDLYERMKHASQRTANPAKDFVPVAPQAATPGASTPPPAMNRKAFEALDAAARQQHIKAGGIVED